MRISTSLIFRTGLETINNQQAELMHRYQQIGTGRRMVTPSDDPLAASRAINLGQTTAQNARFAANREIAKQALNLEDDVLNTVVKAMQDVRTRMVEAGDGAYSDKDRQALAAVLRHAGELLANQANARDGSGQYLFSGSSGDVAPYVQDPSTKNWVPNTANLIAGDRNIQVDESRQISTADMAHKVFQDPATGKDLFAMLNEVVTALDTPVASLPGGSDGLQTLMLSSMAMLDAIYDNVLTVRASVGARGQELMALDSNGDLRDLNYRKELSTLEDANYYEASSMLTLRQAALEAAATAFRRIQSTSLFNPQV